MASLPLGDIDFDDFADGDDDFNSSGFDGDAGGVDSFSDGSFDERAQQPGAAEADPFSGGIDASTIHSREGSVNSSQSSVFELGLRARTSFPPAVNSKTLDSTAGL